MSHKGMIFDSESVRAILAGTKTMTRRVVSGLSRQWSFASMLPERNGAHRFSNVNIGGIGDGYQDINCPYGIHYPPILLYVKETLCWLDEEQEVAGYRATYDPAGAEGIIRWRSPMMMPRSAARLWLRITAVKVERVQDIDCSDCHAEGIEPSMHPKRYETDRFADRWNSINGKKPGCSWEANPWVWCYTFKRVEKPAATPASSTLASSAANAAL